VPDAFDIAFMSFVSAGVNQDGSTLGSFARFQFVGIGVSSFLFTQYAELSSTKGAVFVGCTKPVCALIFATDFFNASCTADAISLYM
tara:strand:+ start:1606 stop:1866 length:261 start_codon:yes stop_codon:yes gene_type:complete